MVTVEAAYALAALAVFVVLGVAAIGTVAAQLRCTDAAREVARLSAAGDSEAQAVGARVAPKGSRIEVHRQGEQVVAIVSAKVPLLPLFDVSAHSVAAMEPDGVEAATVGE
ncbi:pilus assembly protein TadE [Gordonia alkaliphila]|uniref:TadE family type IV pilus minor pilin n=1 Tax=Gordonia alkaliphila TaxID=1053547 RepID=A0ABP8YYU2_9ACTN|nr:TadE family type IV pilus minor pilin [Gordonia alkaliphila]MCK0439280.1 pilus assembly protein TadE [Gordonia alkaliphila]